MNTQFDKYRFFRLPKAMTDNKETILKDLERRITKQNEETYYWKNIEDIKLLQQIMYPIFIPIRIQYKTVEERRITIYVISRQYYEKYILNKTKFIDDIYEKHSHNQIKQTYNLEKLFELSC